MFLSLLMQLLFKQISLQAIQVPPNFNIESVSYLQETVSIPEKKRIDNFESIDVKLQASRAIAIDLASGGVLYKKNVNEVQPIASITKLMTAMVFLDQNLDLDSSIYMIRGDERPGAYNHLYRDEQIALKDLLAASLIPSDNNATIALARSTGMTEAEFVAAMNDKATEIGLENTSFADPSGLDEENLSSAYDVAKLLYNALQYPLIEDLTQQPAYYFNVLNTGRQVKLFSTDYLLSNSLFGDNGDYKILGGKTGYIDEAGYCFASKAKNASGHEVIAVILHSASVDSRFQDMKSLLYWTFTNYEWKK